MSDTANLPTALITHPDSLLHVMDGRHPESPARISTILAQLANQDFYPHLLKMQAPLATDVDLARVHDPAYIAHIRQASPKAGQYKLDPDTAMGPMTLSACLHASGAAILATDLVMQSQARNAFCCTRPPGHHAGYKHAAGFCIFNHVAVAVAYAIEKYQLERIAIIDFDVHHGDGTEDIFSQQPKVMLCSSFQHPFYPFKGADTQSTHIINAPVPAGTDGAELKKMYRERFEPALRQFKPQLFFVSAGFDAHADDPLAQLALTTEDYAWLTQWIMSLAAAYANGRIVSVLEGGYQLQALATSVVTHVRTLYSRLKS